MLTLIGLCILGLVLGNLQNGARASQRVNKVDAGIRFFIEPLAVPMSHSTRAISDFFVGIISAKKLAEENRRLRALELPLALYGPTVELKDRDLDRLRALLQLGPVPGKKRVPASVCGFSINENRLTLNVGSNQGVKLGCPVESADGLVGTIEEVGSNQCQVLMLTSAGLQVTSSGKTQLIGGIDVNRNPPLVGMVRGENASTLSMQFLDVKAPAQIGDLIVTSGYSDVIPRGIAIGKIIQIEPNDELGMLKARLSPSVEPGNLVDVYVLI